MLRVCVCSPPSQTNLFQTNLFQTNHHTITHYHIHQITNSLTRVPGLPGDFAATKKLQEWLVTLNGMRAMDAISEEQVRMSVCVCVECCVGRRCRVLVGSIFVSPVEARATSQWRDALPTPQPEP